MPGYQDKPRKNALIFYVGRLVYMHMRALAEAADIWNHFRNAQGKGERNQAGSADGTNNPFKKLKPDPNKPGNVLEKDSHTGRTVSKKSPRI
jgi:hypothetical protein